MFFRQFDASSGLFLARLWHLRSQCVHDARLDVASFRAGAGPLLPDAVARVMYTVITSDHTHGII